MTWLTALAEKILTRDGLWALIAVGLGGFMLWMYVFEIREIRAKLDDVIESQVRACVRAGVQPVDACWTKAPK